MDPVVFTQTEGGFLSLASLRFLVPPLHFLSASMWQILKQNDVMSFWKVSEFVTLVMEIVPELLLLKHWTQLIIGLRARFILELFQRGEDQQFILSHLENIKLQQSPRDKSTFDGENTGDEFAEMICALLKGNLERQTFFQEVWSDEYGHQFDCDLQTLFWEFLCRLKQLLPVPELEQTVAWLGESSILEDFIRCLSEPIHMKNLLYHHRQLGHLKQHVPLSNMGDHILSSLSAVSKRKLQNMETESDPLSGSNEDPQPISFVEDAAVEIFTECTEIELTSTTNDIQVLVIDNTSPNGPNGEENCAMKERDESQVNKSTDLDVVFIDCTPAINANGEETVIALNEKMTKDMEKMDTSGILKDESKEKDHRKTHDCANCDKKFKFASFLAAHRVIHTGERPHKCSECGQCFSFRQSLERHRHTHRTGKSLEECPSSATHKQMLNKDGGYYCQLCNEKFTEEPALEQHMKTHSDTNGNEEIVEIKNNKEVILLKQNIDEKAVEMETNVETSAHQVIDAKLMSKVISLVQVRTSQRKRKATKKMLSLQKIAERKKEMKAKNVVETPVQTRDSSDHSYGTTTTSSKSVHQDAVAKAASLSCPHCDFNHSEQDEIQQHINKSHSNLSDVTKPQTTKPTREAKEGQRTHCGFNCSICGEQFTSFKDQKVHISSAHMRNGVYFCSRCDKNYTWKAAFVRHVRMYCSVLGSNSFPFPHCELVFDRANKLYSHVHTHQEERVHVCDCGKSYAYKWALNAHQRTHEKERPHVCQQCGKGFLYKGTLRGHMKIHSQETPFVCSHCGKSFKREPNMKKHERCHTGEKVFKCSQCDKSFVYKATLTRHELTHTGERPYLCADCGKGFFSHAELLKHERFHTGHKPFECPHCGKRFTQSCYLTIHLRYHTGAKPYSCSECEKSFLSANRLKRHQRTHTGEKPYVCGECGKGFGQSYHLKMHQRTHVIDLT